MFLMELGDREKIGKLFLSPAGICGVVRISLEGVMGCQVFLLIWN